jgi:hypothetical protein
MADELAATAHRASDAERETAADRLRSAAAEGRLDPDELDERVGQVYAARTVGELATITEDLPDPSAQPGRPAPAWKGEAVREPLAFFIIANVVCNAVWLATGADDEWWPKWVLLGTGIALFVAVVCSVLGVGDDEDEDEELEDRGLPRPT